MAIGKRIKEILDKKDLTVVELSKRSGIPVTTLYSMIKRDKENEKLETIWKISDALEVGVADIIDIVDYSLKESDKITEKYGYAARVLPSLKYDKLLDEFDKLNDTGQNKAVEQVKILTKIPEYKRKKKDE